MSIPFDQIPSLAWDTADWFLGAPGPVPCMAGVQAAVACNLLYPAAISWVIDLESLWRRDRPMFARKWPKSYVWLTHHAKAAYAWREEKGRHGGKAKAMPPRPLSELEYAILLELARAYPETIQITNIATAVNSGSTSVSAAVRELEVLKLADRPLGERSGVSITPFGITVLRPGDLPPHLSEKSC